MELTSDLIAPCGINCGTCSAYLRKKNTCSGCLTPGNNKTHCVTCRIKTCECHKNTPYCYDCDKFPCIRMKKIDKRYREHYNLSLINNLTEIKELGLTEFMKQENIKWVCECGERLSVHRDDCVTCGKKYR